MKRGKKLVLLSHCVLNQNSVVPPLARAKGAFPMVKILLEEGIGVIQLPCPELKFLGINRKSMDKDEYDTKEYRELCRNIFEPVLEEVREYRNCGYNIWGIIGINHSPTCSITGERGIFMEEIFSLLDKEGIELEHFEIPTSYSEENDSENIEERLRELLRKL